MSGPGLSLLQGGEGIQVLNNCLERQDEEEELEDARRRHEELGNLLQNAFDDLNEEDTTMDSTSNFQSGFGGLSSHQKSLHQEEDSRQKKAPVNELYINQQQQRRCSYEEDKNPGVKLEGELHRLRMMLESRTNELREGQQFSKEQARRLDELQKRIMIVEAELERALAAKSNTHELLVESKEKCSNLENAIEKMRNERKQMETERNDLLSKLETTESLLCDVQRKYDMVERDLSRVNERNVELKLKQLEERHRAADELLQERLQQVSNKLEKKSSELEGMTSRYQALQNTHEMMLCEKASRINDLSHKLNEMQKLCDELAAKGDCREDNKRLQKLVDSLQDRLKDQDETMKTLRQRLEATTADLDIMDGVLRQYNQSSTNQQEEGGGGGVTGNSNSTFSTHLSQTQGCFVGSTPIPTAPGKQMAHRDRLSRLKDELLRSLQELKSKREEARNLQKSVQEQQEQIGKLKLEENKNLVQLTMLKEDNIRLSNRYKILQEEYDALRSVKSHYNERKERELEDQQKQEATWKNEMDALRMQLNTLKDECFAHEMEQKRLNVALGERKEVNERLQKEHEELMTKYQSEKHEMSNKLEQLYKELEKQKDLLRETEEECTRFKSLLAEATKAKDAINMEMERLKHLDAEKNLQTERDRSVALQRALQLAEMKAQELNKILEVEKLSYMRELNELREKLEQERALVMEMKQTEMKDCTKCLDYLAQVTKFEIENLKLTNFNANYQREIEDLQSELKTNQDHLSELNEQLKLCGEQETLIKELKIKATQFEEYIRNQAQNQFHSNVTSGVGTLTNPSSVSASASASASSSQATTESVADTRKLCDKNVGTSLIMSEEMDENPRSEEIKKIECRVREEMSEIFADELKKMHRKLQESEEELMHLNKEQRLLIGELKQRQKEVDILKQVIVVERDKMQEILNANEQEYAEKLQNELAKSEKSLRDELQVKSARVKELTKELFERQTQIEAERKSMKAVMKQWEEQCKTLSEVEGEWKQKFDSIQQLHETTLESWRNKYLSAKKMADNYKRYSEDKEAHMLKEYDRLKYGYRVQVANIEKNYAAALEKRKIEVSGKSSGKSRDPPQMRAAASKPDPKRCGKQLLRIDEVEDDDVCAISSSSNNNNNKENDTEAINL